ncbi:hypothetical protein CROQUDRAFT_97907 [Cronartium quercuum f. sp. fusiforme G11]|uniref:Uncharacterized protein n=1 Tax=Cronartium quercuum f. sp. fusiforme G11 TaxID=708437 RepID=A0A9P6NA28_9BASI|nr:hypothetical protein CROQUDRAFT_97907 [Cronartium quercuum f. sp. fusiforme G11]
MTNSTADRQFEWVTWELGAGKGTSFARSSLQQATGQKSRPPTPTHMFHIPGTNHVSVLWSRSSPAPAPRGLFSFLQVAEYNPNTWRRRDMHAAAPRTRGGYIPALNRPLPAERLPISIQESADERAARNVEYPKQSLLTPFSQIPATTDDLPKKDDWKIRMIYASYLPDQDPAQT